jgi:hypothetical protein
MFIFIFTDKLELYQYHAAFYFETNTRVSPMIAVGVGVSLWSPPHVFLLLDDWLSSRTTHDIFRVSNISPIHLVLHFNVRTRPFLRDSKKW